MAKSKKRIRRRRKTRKQRGSGGLATLRSWLTTPRTISDPEDNLRLDQCEVPFMLFNTKYKGQLPFKEEKVNKAFGDLHAYEQNKLMSELKIKQQKKNKLNRDIWIRQNPAYNEKEHMAWIQKKGDDKGYTDLKPPPQTTDVIPPDLKLKLLCGDRGDQLVYLPPGYKTKRDDLTIITKKTFDQLQTIKDDDESRRQIPRSRLEYRWKESLTDPMDSRTIAEMRDDDSRR